MDYISNLPRELVYSNLLKGVDAADVLSLCQSLPQLKKDCMTEEFWQKMVKLYYLEYSDLKPVNISWKQYFQDLVSDKYVIKNLNISVGPSSDDNYTPSYVNFVNNQDELYHRIANKKVLIDLNDDIDNSMKKIIKSEQNRKYKTLTIWLTFNEFNYYGFKYLPDYYITGSILVLSAGLTYESLGEINRIYTSWLNDPNTSLSILLM